MTTSANQDIVDRVRDVVAEVLWTSKDELEDSKLLVDYGLDSPTAIELTVQLEDAFDIRIPEDVAAGLETIDQIVRYVEGVK